MTPARRAIIRQRIQQHYRFVPVHGADIDTGKVEAENVPDGRSVDEADPPVRDRFWRRERIRTIAKVRFMANAGRREKRRQRWARRNYIASIGAQLSREFLEAGTMTGIFEKYNINRREAMEELRKHATKKEIGKAERRLATERQRQRSRRERQIPPSEYRPAQVPVEIGGVRYPSIAAAARATGQKPTTLWQRLRGRGPTRAEIEAEAAA